MGQRASFPLVSISSAFSCADPKGTKKTDNLTVFFALLGSARVKAAHRLLMKWTPGVDFTRKLISPTFFLDFFECRDRLRSFFGAQCLVDGEQILANFRTVLG